MTDDDAKIMAAQTQIAEQATEIARLRDALTVIEGSGSRWSRAQARAALAKS